MTLHPCSTDETFIYFESLTQQVLKMLHICCEMMSQGIITLVHAKRLNQNFKALPAFKPARQVAFYRLGIAPPGSTVSYHEKTGNSKPHNSSITSLSGH